MRPIKFRAWDALNKEMYPVRTLQWDQSMKFPEGYDDPIMQFTGLLDRNGTELYHHDLGRDKRGNLWRVDEMRNATGFGMTCVSDTGAHDELYPQHLSYGWIVLHGLEILGNIYEQPELLI